MSGRLIMLDKQPVVHPAVVGKPWRCLFAKCVLKATGHKATNACQDDHICAVPKVVIDEAVHGVQDIWDANLSTEMFCFLLVDK